MFNIGDVVVLKSGGPKMTVLEIDDSNKLFKGIQCTWFNEITGNFMIGTFPPLTLEKE